MKTGVFKKEQAAKITQERLGEIFEHYPILRFEVKQYMENKDYTRLVFYNGSSFDVVQVAMATKGGRRNGLAAEEVSDPKFDGDLFNEVVVPLMANNRIAKNGKVDPNELHKSEIYICTAGNQQHFAYGVAKEIYNEMLDGQSAFYIGNSYELPCLHDQLDIDFVESKKMSPNFSVLDFMSQYESTWIGSSTDALVSDVKLRKTRNLGVAEWANCGDPHCEYVLSYDVARHEGKNNALSCLCVIKITPRSDGTYLKELVNIFSSEGEHDLWQARFLKQKVDEFKARILVVDAQGIGSGVIDQLVLDIGDGNPPYGVVNNDSYDKYKSPNSTPMVFAMVSTHQDTRNSRMIQHVMRTFNETDISLLKSAHEGLKDYRKKHGITIKESEEQAELEVPYIMTDNLCEELMNLEYKPVGNEGKIEQISSRIPKDKFSSLMYGLWWIYMDERKNVERKRSAVDSKKIFKNFRKVNPYGR